MIGLQVDTYIGAGDVFGQGASIIRKMNEDIKAKPTAKLFEPV